MAALSCHGDDKVKYNGVRALGNLLRYVQPRTLGESLPSVAHLLPEVLIDMSVLNVIPRGCACVTSD